MKARLGSLLALAAAVSLSPQSAHAQLPSATDEQRAAGSRVDRIVFDANPVEAMIGDTTVVSARFLDADGNEVTNVVWALFGFGTTVARTVRDAANPSAYRIVGAEPGEGEFLVVMMVPEAEATTFGRAGIKQMAALAIRVNDYPIDRIDIADVAYGPYTGTSFKMAARVMTILGEEHSLASVTWRSNNPRIASVTTGGVVTFANAGSVELTAMTDEDVTASRSFEVVENPVRQLTMTPMTASTRTGDVIHFDVIALDARGRAVDDMALSYSVFGLDSAGATVYEDGAFVAENSGSYRVIVTAGNLAAQAVVEVEARPAAAEVELVGRGVRSEVTTSDLWVFEGQDGRDYAYTGTHAQGGGERMFVWDVTDPADIVLVDSVVVDARVVNDVKVNGDASWAIITREGASSRRNGIVVLDLADPAHPEVIAELTDNLTGGIHNVWINGDAVYAVNDGTSAMDIIDMSDPHNPTHHGRWELRPGDTDKSLHDVWADGRYAYVSYWDDGLVILDVGAGTHGGTPLDPQFVSRVSYDMGNTHTAWREGNYVFVGDELPGPSGYIHVFDVSDIENPEEVARYDVPEAGAHNIWVEGGMLYVAYYNGGLRVVDITGELRGDLYRQGREVGRFATVAPPGEAVTPNAPLAWGPQPHKGNIFLTDMNSGLWVVKHRRPDDLSP